MNYPELDLSVLKSIITNKQYALDFVGTNTANIFDVSLWHVANLIVQHIKTYKDVPTLNILVDKIPNTNSTLIETINNTWKQIEATSYNEKEFKHKLEKLQYRFSVEQIVNLKSKLEHVNNDSINPNKVIKDLQNTIQTVHNITKTKTYDRKTLKESVGPFRDELNAKRQDPTFDRGIPTYYSFMDLATGGLRASELLIVAGATGAGKSMLLMNIGLQMWKQKNTIDMTDNFSKGFNVLYFSLEMPFKSCRNRVYSCLSGVPTRLIKEPVDESGNYRMSSENKNKLKEVFRFIDQYPYQFEIVDIPRGANMDDIENIFEDAKTKYNPDIVAIDYLGIMSDDSKEDDWLKLGTIAGKFHEFCRAKNVVGLTAVQLNRTKSASKETEEKIGVHRIGRSALILTHADICLQIEERPNEQNYPDMIAHLIKVRDGEKGKGKMIKNLACGSLLDDSEVSEENMFKSFDDISDKVDDLDI